MTDSSDESFERLRVVDLTQLISTSQIFNSLRAILHLSSTTSKFFLLFIICINIFAGVIPVFYFLEISYAIQAMGNNYHNLEKYYEAMQTICIYLLGAGAIYILISTISTFLAVIFSRMNGDLWRKLYFKSLLEQDPGFYDLNPDAISESNINTECKCIEEALGDDLMMAVTATSLLIGLIITAMTHSLELTLICLIIYPAQYLGLKLTNVKSEKSLIKSMKMYSLAGLKSIETIENIKTVASLNCQESRISEYSQCLMQLQGPFIKEGIKNGIGWGLNFSVMFAIGGIMFYVATLYISEQRSNWTQGKLSIADLYFIFYCFFMGSMLIATIFTSLKKIQRGVAISKKIIGLVNQKKESEKLIPNFSDLTIIFDQVEFSYPSKPTINILSNLSFTMHPHAKIGFVGKTGSGKSSIAQLILGFYSRNSGTITINEIDISDIDIKKFRDSIAYVNQEPLLYSDTIKNNIKLGNKNCTKQDIETAAIVAEAMNFIEALPEKMDTFVGNNGSQLSGGEKQRIALARALIRNPKLIILDEATSALDAITESTIIDNITLQFSQISIIVIAQRLKTVKNLDIIHYVQDGKIIESGSFDELCSKNGHFYDLVQASQQDNDDKEDSIISNLTCPKVCMEDINTDRDNRDIPQKSLIKISLIPTDYRCLLLIIIVSSIISGGAFPLFGFSFARCLSNLFSMDNSVNEQNFEIMWYIIADAVALFIALIIMNYSLAKLFITYTEKLRTDSFSSLVYYDSDFFDKSINSPHALSALLRDESQKISSLGGPALSIPLLLLFSEVGGFILAMTQHYVLAIIKFALALAHLYIINKCAVLMNGKSSSTGSDKLSNIASNSLSNFKIMTAFNLQKFFYRKYDKEQKRLMRGKIVASLKIGFILSLRLGIDFFNSGVFLFIAAYLAKIGLVEVGDIIQIQQVLNCATWALLIVAVLLPDITAAISASKAVNQLLNYNGQINAKSDDGIKSPISGIIEFSNVTFSYPSKSLSALKSCSFILEPGQSLGITGKSGSGKSTIAMLLLRFYNPSSGFIYIDGVRIEDYNIAHLRSRIAWVGQEPVLFQGSILQNLQLGNSGLTREQAMSALEKAQASDVVENYGLETDVGVRGSFLSGGQKQRIAIARALARESDVLILDEATSALDNITEENLRNSLREQNTTVIAIAHKIDTISSCDKIIIIDKGSILEEGTHSELIKMRGLYRTFSRTLSLV